MKAFFTSLTCILLLSCNDSGINNAKTSMDKLQISNSVIDIISNKNIYFGHHSIGYNITSGIEQILSDTQKNTLHLVDSTDFSTYKNGMFGHSRIGYNTDPVSKIIGFVNHMDNTRNWKPDIAMFKFCYIDFAPDTDVNHLFNEYKSHMDSLKAKYPETTFIHFTVPLTTIQTGIKAEIKKLIGKPLSGQNENIKRNQFNDLLIKSYESKEPVFDLARIESTKPDKTRSYFEINKIKYYTLAEDYTNDGKHLNNLGRKITAYELINYIANLN